MFVVLLSATTPIAITIALLASISSGHAAPSRYLCTDGQAVGLHYELKDRTWTPHAFVDARYVLRELTLADQDRKTQKYAPLLSGYPEATWAFFEDRPLDPQPIAVCRVSNVSDKARFICKPISVDARFDPGSRRFQIIRGQGYIDQGIGNERRREHPGAHADLLSHGSLGGTNHPMTWSLRSAPAVRRIDPVDDTDLRLGT
jgi:hypothetical protein